MAAKQKSPEGTAGPRGPRGQKGKPGERGLTGKQGRRGPAGPDRTGEIRALRDEVAALAHEMQTQLSRIAQIQAQLDRLASEHEPESPERRKTLRTTN